MTLGVIGGLGPIATAYFMELVIKMTDAHCDQEHLEMIIYNCPQIPDRTEYLLGRSKESPLVPMIEIGKRLCGQNVSFISIPCITGHYFHKELSENIGVPIIHAIRETVLEIQKDGLKRAGIMATDGTLKTGIFQKELEAQGLEAVLCEPDFQEMVMDIIYKNVKAGMPVDFDKFRAVSAHLREKGADVIVLGCTELSLVKRDYPIGPGYLDAMEVLAQRSIVSCGARLKKEYRNLITG